MTSTIQFEAGKFLNLRVAKAFHLGKFTEDLPLGELVQFDGETLKFRKKDLPCPELKALLKTGWLVLADSPDSVVAASPRPNAMPVSREQQQVSVIPSLANNPMARPANRTANEPKPFSATLVREDSGDGRVVGQAVPDGFKADFAPPRRTLTGVESEQVISNQARQAMSRRDLDDSKVERRFPPINKERVSVTDSLAVNREINRLDNLEGTTILGSRRGGVVAVETDNLQDMVAALDPAGRSALQARERQVEHKRELARQTAEAAKAARMAQVQKDAVASGAVAPTEDEVAQTVAALEAEDDAALVEVAPAAVAPVVKIRVKQPDSIEELLVTGDNTRIAPNLTWDKKLHWRTRAKQAVELYYPRPTDTEDVVRAKATSLAQVRAFEEKSVVALIDQMVALKQTLPQ